VGTKADLLPSWPPTPPDSLDAVVSGTTGQGVDELRALLTDRVSEAKAAEPPRTPYVVLRPGRESFQVRREGNRFRVSGPRVERWVKEVDLDDHAEVAKLQRQLSRAGVERRLVEAGARRGDEVVIGGAAFEFIPDEEFDPKRDDPAMSDTGRDDDQA
jgi:GTP-binding protein